MTRAANLLSASQVAEHLGVSVRTVHRMVSAGDLRPAMKAPGKTGGYLFRPASIEQAKAKREATTAESVAS